MKKDRVLLIAADKELGTRVSKLLEEVGVCTKVFDPNQEATATSNADAHFDAAYEMEATAVVFIEPLPRFGSPHAPPCDGLLQAALRAARAPIVTGFGWVTAGGNDDALAELQQQGKPFGTVVACSLIEIVVDANLVQTKGRVLIDADTADRAAEIGAIPIEDAAKFVASWIAEEGMRCGTRTRVQSPEAALARAIELSGFEPRVLANWRVGLNGLLGSTVLDRDDDQWVVRRRPWRWRRSTELDPDDAVVGT